jgi:hypothetical protein
MRSMERNKVPVWYALYSGKVPVLDSEGYETGEYTSGYSLPVKIRIRVSPNRGEATNQFFGTLLDYDSTMITTDELPIDEYSILWIGKAPVLNDGAYPVDLDGNLITGHTHKVVRVANDINVTQYAIKKVSV